ncbi:DNA phosphorothioation system sulfurtransferase DndC [Phenylobacterium sp. RIFCSPHIGHO2_01_FULL_69_31]|uniref:DNA phosphorothioation system sulfurtransferase DndC n=1 Tax=Phenylobacterium sp. RIFCSPHIGHO2_01_FULL_69_31 TaxID=1801944 RepID=UPI000B2142C3|nr:DNA phosphorothioation system sulfurtransferase DndC [Phenylobacterium sp. RIFCSPHIGHO2_01_FULL_69_31]
MSETDKPARRSAFTEAGFRPTLAALLQRIQDTYLADEIPWVVGYSGGKDSTAVLQLVWLALAQLPKGAARKDVHVISTDTLVENPVVAAWVDRSHHVMGDAARAAGLPIYPHKLTPDVQSTFWVNLIGRGYPAPRPKFRWCTERMKIRPADAFIGDVVRKNGEAIVVLGTRKAESTVRAARMNANEAGRVRENLSTHASLPNAFVYSPIADWSNDDVWLFLMQVKNPWKYDNKALLNMYQGASADAECPIVLDTSTPSCGDSRFGCWVCTLVTQDKSMSAMIQNDEEKEWMSPLLELRNALDEPDHEKRDFRRMGGHVQLFNQADKPIPGPYTQTSRADWLRRLLRAQQIVRNHPKAPPEVRGLDLITMDELHEIRRIWVVEKYEIEDILPALFEEETGQPFPAKKLDDAQPFGPAEMRLLKACAGDDQLHFELVRELLEVERSYRTTSRRAKLHERLEDAFKRSFYDGVEDATERAVRERTLGGLVEKVGAANANVTAAATQLLNELDAGERS